MPVVHLSGMSHGQVGGVLFPRLDGIVLIKK